MRRKAKEVEREGEELAENVFGLSMAQQQSREEGYNFGDFIPKIGEGYYDEGLYPREILSPSFVYLSFG